MQRTKDMPLWVFLGLLNIESRKGALMLVWGCFAFTLACIPLSYFQDDWSWLGMMIALTAWYGLSLRWMDRHSAWQVAAAGKSGREG